MNRITALILDWAGTTSQFRLLRRRKFSSRPFIRYLMLISPWQEARVPMGLGKWQHIEALGKLPSVDARWQAKFGRAMTAADIDAIYAAFMPLQIAKVVDFSAPIAGVVETISALRAEGLKVGSCSGYPRPVMLEKAGARRRRRGLCAGLLGRHRRPRGRRPSSPWMALQNVIALGIDAVAHCVKVDDAARGLPKG